MRKSIVVVTICILSICLNSYTNMNVNYCRLGITFFNKWNSSLSLCVAIAKYPRLGYSQTAGSLACRCGGWEVRGQAQQFWGLMRALCLPPGVPHCLPLLEQGGGERGGMPTKASQSPVTSRWQSPHDLIPHKSPNL